jgi:RNA polymerase sigma-70 factor (ECF subfamily)
MACLVSDLPIGYIYLQNSAEVSVTGKELALALQNGDEVVYEQVFRDYYERLCNYANTLINDMDEAEEMVQSTFLILWEKRESIDIHTSVKSYLYQAVHNHCLNRLKHFKVRQAHTEHFKYHNEAGFDNNSQQLIFDELEKEVNNAIESLPDQCRHVFKLSRFENLTYAEIAEQLNISVKTIENHMGKALRILRERLKEYLPLLIWFLFRDN